MAPLQLKGITHGGRDEMTLRIRDAFGVAGAWITDVHFFSGVYTVFTFEVACVDARALASALVATGLALDEPGRAALEAAATAAGEGDVAGTLAVTFAEGDPDMTRDVPAVPG
jgi:hypothetical protein